MKFGGQNTKRKEKNLKSVLSSRFPVCPLLLEPSRELGSKCARNPRTCDYTPAGLMAVATGSINFSFFCIKVQGFCTSACHVAWVFDELRCTKQYQPVTNSTRSCANAPVSWIICRRRPTLPQPLEPVSAATGQFTELPKSIEEFFNTSPILI